MNISLNDKILAVLLLFSPFLFQSCADATGNNQEPESTSNEKVIFFDDFAGPGLDSSKWNMEITGIHVNNELQAYIDSSSVLKFVNNEEAEGAVRGAIRFTPVYSPGYTTADSQRFDFTSARINTKNKVDVLYGNISARIKVSDGIGLWPAFWLLGKGQWPETGEIDIMEYVGEKDWVSAAVHGIGYSGDAGLVNRLYFPDSNNATNWHTYAVEWGPDYMIFKYDDIPMFRVTKTMTTFFGPWAFDNPKYLILNFAVGGVYPYKINGIKEPYYGLSASALQMIKAGNAKMLVDWVKVTALQ